MVKIAMLTPQLVPNHPGGGQMLKVVQSLAEEHEFTVFGAAMDDSLSGKVQFHKLPIPRMRPLLGTYLAQFWIYGRLFQRRQMHKEFDIVHSLEGSAPLATVVTMHFCGARALDLMRQGILQVRGIRAPYYRLLYKVGGIVERRVVTNPYLERLICVSEGLKREITHYYNAPVEPVVIPNSVRVERFAEAKEYREQVRHQLRLPDEQVVGAICALGDWERKGLSILIEAVALLPRDTVKVIVIGGGPIEVYRKCCEEKGVADDFVFVGFVRDVERFYGAADFFIFPTAYEAWPIVALEAAATGLPLLATRVNGLEDFIEDGVNGFFTDRTPRSVADTIKLAVRDAEQLQIMGQEAQRRVLAFRMESMVDAYRCLYEELA
jgi:glycosyltransferase involved in cell wall biosynthesis